MYLRDVTEAKARIHEFLSCAFLGNALSTCILQKTNECKNVLDAIRKYSVRIAYCLIIAGLATVATH